MQDLFIFIKRAIKYFPQIVRGLFYRVRFKKSKRMLISSHFRLLNGKNICVGDDFRVGSNMRIECIVATKEDILKPKLIIGDHTYFGDDCHIGVINKITIGSGVLTGRGVFITDHSHGSTEFMDDRRPMMRPLISKGEVSIGNNVWLGDNVAIMPGIIIGDGAIIGANSVVTKNIPPNSVAAGAPAKVIRTLKNLEESR